MSINSLRALLGKDAEQRQQKPKKKPTGIGMAIQELEAWKALAPEKKSKVQSDAASWFEEEAVVQREAGYWEKVFSPIEEAKGLSPDAKVHLGDYICHKFATSLGYSNATQLQGWQIHTLRLLIGVCLDIYPVMADFNAHTQSWIFVHGPVGVGKTSIFKSSEKDLRLCVVSAKTLQGLAEIGGSSALHPYFKRARLVIDDIGLELPANHFGTKIDAVAEIVHHRYMEQMPTHFSSNSTPDELEARYGRAIADRLRACKLISISDNTPSFRRKV